MTVRQYLSTTFFALHDRNYRLFAAGQTISAAGTWMQKLAQAWLVLTLTDSGFVLGLTVALQQLPTLLFSTVAGSLVDRFDKRRLVMLTTVAGALPAVALGALVQLDLVQVWMVMVAALVQGAADVVDKPGRMTLVNDIAGPEILTNAVAINNIVQECGRLIGPAVGGLLIGAVGMAPVFYFNAVSYLVVLVMLVLVRSRPRADRTRAVPIRGNLSGSLRYVGARPPLLVALVMMAVTGLFAYNMTILVPLLTRDVLGGDAAATGFALTSVGLGGVVGGLALARFIDGRSRTQIVMGLALAAALTAITFAPTLWVGYALLFLLGAASVSFKSAAGSVLQLGSDPDMRGRIVALYFLALAGTSPMGGPVQGWIAEVVSPRCSIALAAVTTAAVSIWGCRHLKFSGRPTTSA